MKEIRKIVREILKEVVENPVTKNELNRLEIELDNLFRNVGVDVEFTRHFLDRLNDERNGEQITIEELRQMFYGAYKIYGKKFRKLPDGEEGVMKNTSTNVNVPFVLDKDTEDNLVDLINKTIMRKKDFRASPTDTILNINPNFQPPDNTPKEREPMVLINGVKWIVDVENERLVKKNNREQFISLDKAMEKLDEPTQEKILAFL